MVNAHRINSGEYPYVNEKEKDFFFMERTDEQSIVALISELATTRLSAYYDGIDPIKDIQIFDARSKGNFRNRKSQYRASENVKSARCYEDRKEAWRQAF